MKSSFFVFKFYKFNIKIGQLHCKKVCKGKNFSGKSSNLKDLS